MSRLDHIELPSNFENLSDRDKARTLIGMAQNNVAELKNLKARVEDLLDQIEQLGGSITNITNIITDEFKKHAWTHSSKRDDVVDSGTDPIGPYDFDFTGEHNWNPAKDEVPVQIHASGGGDGTHTTNVFETYDRDDAKAVEHTDEGNVLVNAATERAKVNIRGAATPPTSISDLEFWFDSRTIEADNPGITDDAQVAGIGWEITTWRDQSQNAYVATANKEGTAIWKPLYYKGESWAGSDDVMVVFTPDEDQNDGVLGTGQAWFDLNSTFVSQSGGTEQFTVIAVGGNKNQFPLGFNDGNDPVHNHEPLGKHGMIVGDTAQGEGWVNGASKISFAGHPLLYTGSITTTNFWSLAGNSEEYAGSTADLFGYDLQILTFIAGDPESTLNRFRAVDLCRFNGNDQTGGALRQGSDGCPFTINKIAGVAGAYMQIAMWNRVLTLAEVQSVEAYFATVYSANANNFNLPVNEVDQQEPNVEGARDILDMQDVEGTTRAVVDFEGKLGLDVDPTYRIDVEDATQAQQRWKYDDDNTMTCELKTTGEAIFDTTRIKGTGASASQVGVKLPLLRLQAISSVIGDEPFIFVQDRGVAEGDVCWLVIKNASDVWEATALKFFGSFPASFPT